MDDSTRLAALTVHAMSMSDQKWILARLTLDQRSNLEPLLLDLERLGIPRDLALVQQAIREQAQLRQKDDADDKWRSLAEAKSDTVVSVLKNEPDALIARILSLSSWPWRHALLSAIGTERAKTIQAAGAPIAAPALDTALLSQLSEQVATAVHFVPRSANSGSRGLQKLWARR